MQKATTRLAQRYRGLRGGQHIAVTDGDAGLLGAPEVARPTDQRGDPTPRPVGEPTDPTPPPGRDRRRLSRRSDLAATPKPDGITARGVTLDPRRVPGVMQARSPTKSSRTSSGFLGSSCG